MQFFTCMECAPLRCAIKETLAFFSLFGYPLTGAELVYNLKSDVVYSAGDICASAFEWAREKGSPIAFGSGFFFLSGQEDSVRNRTQNFLTHLPKFARARRAARLISCTPFLRMAAICNTVALAVSTPESDIDFFIIARQGRIWTVRVFTALIMHLAGLRRHGKRIANRVCLSFYAADSALDLSYLRLPDGDIYLTYWPLHLIVLFDAGGEYTRFASANEWVRSFVPRADFLSALYDARTLSDGRIARTFRRVLENILAGRLGDVFERFCKAMQMYKMRHTRRNAKTQNRGVVVSDSMLKFHEHDRRIEFQRLWIERLNQ